VLPTRLELRNFLAYRSPDPIILEELHLACLVGENGAGKSSLLDAITWALWGKARTRSDDDLIHLGEGDMQVTLEFLQGNQRYRVIRTRKIGNRRKSGGRTPGQSALDFFAFDEDGKPILISEPAIRATQQKINSLLHLDYDVFIHSAFLKQGNADAFTVKTPAQRKEILAEILRLDRWSLYEDAAKDQIKTRQQQIDLYTARIEDIDKEIASESLIRSQLETAQDQLMTAEDAVQAAEAHLESVKGADIELRNAQKSMASLEFEYKQREENLQIADTEISRLIDEIAKYQVILDDAENIEAGIQKLEAAQQASEALSHKLVELRQIDQRINDITVEIDKARQSIELDQREAHTQADAEQVAIQKGAQAAQDLDMLITEIAEWQALETERETQQETIQALTNEQSEKQGENQHLKAEMDELKNRLDLLETTTDPTCPVCGQALNAEQRQNLITETTAEGKQRGDRYRDNETRIRDITQEVRTMRSAIQEMSTHLKRLPALQSRKGSIDQIVQEAEAAQGRYDQHQAKIETLNTILEKKEFAEALQQQLTEAEHTRQQLAYDETEHQTIQSELETYRNYQQKANDLELANRMMPSLQENVANQQKQKERYQASIQQYAEQISEQKNEIQRLTVKQAEMQEREKELQHQRERRMAAQESVIQKQQALTSIAKQRERRIEFLERIDTFTREKIIYDQLKTAFGKNGVPAMIIDATIPELENATNDLLGRMTNGQMKVMFQTQREKKTGGVAETLDIFVSDNLGTRDYSLFSGGEAFRVNFAIRVALSQMLARRAGAQLRTLFIDEGFGTQDNQGRERLVEAITTIQDDFDLILVITHIEELKDAFPARVEVTKTNQGSFARIR